MFIAILVRPLDALSRPLSGRLAARNMSRSEHLSPLQLKASDGKFPPVPEICVVTGGTGFVGGRLVESQAGGWLNAAQPRDAADTRPTAANSTTPAITTVCRGRMHPWLDR